MRYMVTPWFYEMVNRMVAVALQNGNTLEYELAVDLLRDITIDE